MTALTTADSLPKAFAEYERRERLRELQVALEAAEYAASRLAELSAGAMAERFRAMQDRYCDERSILIAGGER